MKTYDEDDINNPRSPRRRGGDSDSDTVSRARLGTDGKGNEIVGTGLRRYIKSSMLIYLRYWFIAFWVMAGAAYIVSHAYDTTVTHRQQWMDKANEELQKEVVIPPRRGEILADDGSVLATNLTYYTLRMDMRAASFKEKQFVASLDSLCDSLATMTPGVSSEDWQRRFNRELGKKKGERNRRLTLLRDISYADKERVRTTWPFFHIWSNPNKTGLTIDPREMRSYPYGEMAKRSIGRVGQTKDNSEVHGISGLEKALDKKLFGKPGIARKVPLTHNIVNWTDVPAVDGATLRTTINVGMQDIVDNELNKVLLDCEAQWGAAILMETSTGDIKAISNLERDSVTGTYGEAMYYVLQGYEPGSVMKVISMTIALEDGFAPNLDQMYNTAPYRYGGGKPIKDTHGPVMKPVRRFLEYSSNVGMTKLMAPHYEHDINSFRERVRKFGLLEPFNTGISGEQPAYFPTLDPKRGGKRTMGDQTYGYGSRIPPLYTCAFFNAIANNGRFVRPRIVSAVRRADGTDSLLPVTYVRDRICSEENARILREMMHGVIYKEGGTAKHIKSKLVEMCGKTGTAHLTHEITPAQRKAWLEALKKAKTREDSIAARPVVPPGYREGHYRLAFCGMFPYDKPKYTCMVLISDPKPGVRSAEMTSGTVFRNIAEKMYSRGWLGNSSSFHAEADGTPVSAKGKTPVLYGGMDGSRRGKVKGFISATSVESFRTPAATAKGTVPDVRGLSVRDALRILSKAGYKVKAGGSGYVATQTPAPGTAAPAGSRVALSLETYTYAKPAAKKKPAVNKEPAKKEENETKPTP